MGKIGHCTEKVSPDSRGVPSAHCPLKTGFTVHKHMVCRSHQSLLNARAHKYIIQGLAVMVINNVLVHVA